MSFTIQVGFRRFSSHLDYRLAFSLSQLCSCACIPQCSRFKHLSSTLEPNSPRTSSIKLRGPCVEPASSLLCVRVVVTRETLVHAYHIYTKDLTLWSAAFSHKSWSQSCCSLTFLELEKLWYWQCKLPISHFMDTESIHFICQHDLSLPCNLPECMQPTNLNLSFWPESSLLHSDPEVSSFWPGCPFFDHLQGVQHVLEDWGEKRDVCLIGLYHSIYGSELFVSFLQASRFWSASHTSHTLPISFMNTLHALACHLEDQLVGRKHGLLSFAYITLVTPKDDFATNT